MWPKMSTINMLKYYIGTIALSLTLYMCDSAVLLRTVGRSGIKSLEATPEYFISKEMINDDDVCVIKAYNDTATQQSHFTHVHCSDVTGRSHPLHLTADKYLHLRDSNMYIAPGQYCVTRRNPARAKVCPYALPSSPPFTWKKCCPPNQLVDLANSNSCAPSSLSFRLSFHGKNSTFLVMNTYKADFGCPAGHSLRQFTTDACASKKHSIGRFHFSANGTIQYETTAGVFLRKSVWHTMDGFSNPYCLDGVTSPVSNCNNDASTSFQLKQQRLVNDVEINDSGSWPISWDDDDSDDSGGASTFYSICGSNNEYNDGESGVWKQQKLSTVLFACIPNEHISPEPLSENISSKTTILAFIWLLTCPLLLGAALGNSCIIQRNVHGWILTCYLLSMFILNILSAIVIVNVGREQEGKGCRPVDFMIKFMYMSTLCWMSSINFGLHKTFRHALPQPQPVGCRRFITSVIFSLGFPAISVALCYYVAHYYTDHSCGDLPYCILYDPMTIPYYTVPMHFLVLGNFAIFLKTSYTITKLRNEAEDVLQRQAHDHLKSFALFAKLFLLTGCIWLLRVVLFILQIKGQYLSWYGVILETVFSVPEVVFPIIVFHHPEFIKWSWNRVPMVSSFIFKFNPLFNVSNTK